MTKGCSGRTLQPVGILWLNIQDQDIQYAKVRSRGHLNSRHTFNCWYIYFLKKVRKYYRMLQIIKTTFMWVSVRAHVVACGNPLAKWINQRSPYMCARPPAFSLLCAVIVLIIRHYFFRWFITEVRIVRVCANEQNKTKRKETNKQNTADTKQGPKTLARRLTRLRARANIRVCRRSFFLSFFRLLILKVK